MNAGKICTNCHEWKSSEDFAKHKWHKDGLTSWCCDCRNKQSIRRQQKRRLKLVLMKGGRCIECGEPRPWLLLFHHRKPEEKLIEVRTNHCGRSWNALVAEIEKCDLLCHNCHHLLHIAPYIDIYKDLVEELIAENSEPKQLDFDPWLDDD